jgi:hypothetical protein
MKALRTVGESDFCVMVTNHAISVTATNTSTTKSINWPIAPGCMSERAIPWKISGGKKT